MGYWKMNITCQKSFSASCVKISQCKLSRTSDLTMSNYSSCWLISSLVTVGVESILPSSSNKYFILSSKYRIDIFIDLFFLHCCWIKKKYLLFLFGNRPIGLFQAGFFPLQKCFAKTVPLVMFSTTHFCFSCQLSILFYYCIYLFCPYWQGLLLWLHTLPTAEVFDLLCWAYSVVLL